MKILKAVSVLIFVFGLFNVLLGLSLLLSVDQNTRLLEEMQKEGMGQGIDAQALRLIVIRSAVEYVAIGIPSMISAAGLFFRQNWSRWLWLAIVVVILSSAFYGVGTKVWYGNLEIGGLIEYFLISVIIGSSGLYFLRARTKSFFSVQSIVH